MALKASKRLFRGGSWFKKPAAGDLKQQLEVVITNSEGHYPKMTLADSKLEVRILGARNLPAADVYLMQEGSSDPYCKCLGYDVRFEGPFERG